MLNAALATFRQRWYSSADGVEQAAGAAAATRGILSPAMTWVVGRIERQRGS